jgi:hypothetical protein
VLKKLTTLLRDFGFLDSTLYLLNRVLIGATSGRVRLYKYYIMQQPVPINRLLPRRHRSSSIHVKKIYSNDPAVCDFPRPPAVIADRFRQGSHCFAAYKNGVFAGFLWFTIGRYQEDEVRCNFILSPAQQLAWDFDVYVDPQFRLSRAFLLLWETAYEFMRTRAVCATISRVSAFNTSSIATHTRLGARKLHSLLFFQIWRYQLLFSSTTPRFHFSGRNRERPNILINISTTL